MTTRILVLGLLLLAPARSFAAFEDFGAGARAPGMGNVFTAVADDVYAIHYNPAGLALLSRPEFGTSYTRLLTGLSDSSEISTSFLGYAHPLEKGRWGAAGVSLEQASLNGGIYEDQALTISYGRLLSANMGPGSFYGGINAKYLRRSFGAFPEATNATNGEVATNRPDPVLNGRNHIGIPAADLGLLYRWKEKYAVGLAILNANEPNVAFSPGETDRLPRAVKLGVNYRGLLSNLGVEYESRQSPLGTMDRNLGVAAERWFPRLFIGEFGLRGGLNLGSRDYRQITLGLSYRTGRFGVDYGFALPINSVASNTGSHRVGLSIRFGSLREPDESVLMILEAMRQIKLGKAPEFHALGPGLTTAQKAQLDEFLALAQSLESSAQYKAALERLSQALAVSPGNTELLKSFGRLNWVAQQIKELPNYKSDPVQSAWHQGILAYLGGNDAVAVEKVSSALSLNPDNKALDGFLAQLELATGLSRPAIVKAPEKSVKLEELLTRTAAAIERGDYDAAIALSQEILKEDENNLSAWENLGTSYFAVGEYPDSLAAWRRAYALEKNPARRSVLDGYLKSLRKLLSRPPKPAMETEPRAQKTMVSPLEIQRIYDSGVDFYTSGQLEKARLAFKKVLDLDPAYVPATKALRRVVEEINAK